MQSAMSLAGSQPGSLDRGDRVAEGAVDRREIRRQTAFVGDQCAHAVLLAAKIDRALVDRDDLRHRLVGGRARKAA